MEPDPDGVRFFCMYCVLGDVVDFSKASDQAISMTDGFKENVGVHFAITLILGFMTLSIELFVNNKNLNPKEKAIKAGIPIVLFTLIVFAFSTVFLYS